MPRLLLLRHAKAENAPAGGGDHERALSEGGKRHAAKIGRIMQARGESVELVLCSTSLRTRMTWELVQPALPGSPEVRFLRGIYTAEDDYLDLLHAEADIAGSVLLVGHNPAIQRTATVLASEGGSLKGWAFASKFPTAAVVILNFEESWADLRPGTAQPVAFISVDDLPGI